MHMTQTYSPPLAASPGVDRAAWAALLVGTAIVAWSGVLVRFLAVGRGLAHGARGAGARRLVALGGARAGAADARRPRRRRMAAGAFRPRLRRRRRFLPLVADGDEGRQRLVHRQRRADPGGGRRRAVFSRARRAA